MRNWAADALCEIERGEPVALVTVIAAEGSTPREAGARMLVGRERLSGTIGGGNLEYRATDQARKLLGAGAGFAVQDYPLGPFLQQCCGGHVRLLIERLDGGSVSWLSEVGGLIDKGRAFELKALIGAQRLERSVLADETQWVGALAPPVRVVCVVRGPNSSVQSPRTSQEKIVQEPHEPHERKRTPKGRREAMIEGDALIERIDAALPTLTVFGAGHVGAAIMQQFAALAFKVETFDSREEASGPGVAVCDEDRLIASAAALGDDAIVLILTHNHELDYRLTRAVLGHGFRYCGLIGSKTKRVRFINRLRADGVGEEAIARLTCPIGLPSLKSKAPEVIAVAVAAQLLELVQ